MTDEDTLISDNLLSRLKYWKFEMRCYNFKKKISFMTQLNSILFVVIL